MAAGLGFKTFTTGEVLTAADTNGYLMQGVLVFASAAARDAAITSPQEGQFAYLKDTNVTTYYTGSAWANLDTTGMTNPMTTTGDTIYSSPGSTPNRLGIGTTGQVLTVAGGVPSWATPASGSTNVSGKNAVLNSNFNIWQRGTSIAASGGSGVYTADRWSAYNASYTISQQATSDTTNLPFISNCARVQRRAGETSTGGVNFVQPLETVNSKPFIGKVATLSFYARAGANYSSASNGLLVFLLGGTGTDQNPNNTYTGQSSVISQTATLTTTWQRFSYTSSTIATTVNELAVQLTSIGVGTAGAADYFEVTGVQLEIAAAVSDYSPNTSTYALELAACQRYFAALGAVSIGIFESANAYVGSWALPCAMRTTPSITLSGTITGYGVASGNNNISAVSLKSGNVVNQLTVAGTGPTGGAGTGTYTYGTGAILASAEL